MNQAALSFVVLHEQHWADRAVRHSPRTGARVVGEEASAATPELCWASLQPFCNNLSRFDALAGSEEIMMARGSVLLNRQVGVSAPFVTLSKK